jgi:hypothetical protein
LKAITFVTKPDNAEVETPTKQENGDDGDVVNDRELAGKFVFM